MENLPLGRNAIGNKWVFKMKTKPDGLDERFKARMVAYGFNQRVRVDYSETLSTFVRLNTLRNVLAIVAKRNMYMHLGDIETAFLNACLHDDIYINPKGQRLAHLASGDAHANQHL
jgi:hypothetical protein